MNCKYMKADNYTPSDYDIMFDVSEIPSNIEERGSMDLVKSIHQSTPLTRRVHLNLRSHDEAINCNTSITTQLNVNGRRIL